MGIGAHQGVKEWAGGIGSMPEEPTQMGGAAAGKIAKLRRWLPRLVGGAAVALLLLLGLVLSAPTLLSTGWGTRWAVSLINGRIAGTVAAANLDLAWFSGQRIEGLDVTDPQGSQVLTAQAIEAPEATLWSLLRGRWDIGAVRVVNPVVTLRQAADGTINLTRALAAKGSAEGGRSAPTTPQVPEQPSLREGGGGEAQEEPIRIPADLRLQLSVENGRVFYESAAVAPVELEGLNLEANLSSPSHIRFVVKAQLHQGGEDGLVDLDVTLQELFDPAGVPQPAQVSVDAQAVFGSLPVAAIDRLLGQGGRLTALLGPVLDARAEVRGGANCFEAAMVAQSENFNADFGLVKDRQNIAVKPGSTVHLRVLPDTWAWLAPHPEGFPVVKLVRPFELAATVPEFQVLCPTGRLDPAQTHGRGTLTAEDVILEWDGPAGGRWVISGTEARFELDGPSQTVRASVLTTVEHSEDLATVELTVIARRVLDEHGELHWDRASAELHGGATHVPVAWLDDGLESGRVLQACLGPIFNVTVDGAMRPLEGGGSPVGSFVLTGQAKHLNATLSGEVSSDALVLEPGGQVTLGVQPGVLPAVIERYGASWPERLRALRLIEPATVRLQTVGAKVPLKAFDPTAIEAGLRLTVDGVAVAGVPWAEGLALREVALDMPKARLERSLPVSLGARLEYQGQPASVRGHMVTTGLAGAGPPELTGEISIEQLPVGLIDGLAGMGGEVERYLGSVLDRVTVDLERKSGQPLSVAMQVRSSRLGADLGALYTPEDAAVVLRDPSTVSYTITPELVESLQAGAASKESDHPAPSPPRFRLREPAVVELGLGGSRVGLARSAAPQGDEGAAGPAPIDWDRTYLAGWLRCSPVTLDKAPQAWAARLEQFRVTATSEDLRRLIALEATGLLSLQEGGGAAVSPKGQIASTTRIIGLFDEGGRIDPEHAVVETNTKVEQLPVEPIDALFGWGGYAVDALGQQVTLAVEGRYSRSQPGQLKATAEAEHAQLKLAAELNDSVTLLESATARFHVTPALSRRWLSGINPLLTDAVSSDQPVTLTVKREGFRWPLKASAFSEAQAEAQLNLGVMRFSEGGLVTLVWDLFKRTGGGPHVMQFTPMNLRLARGVLSYRDMTLTMDNLVLGFRGQVDQGTRQVDLVMAIDGATMAKAFDLRDVIEPGYSFEVPIRGTIDRPKLDAGAFAAEVTRLVAKAELKKRLGGAEGEAAGALLDLLLGGGKKKGESNPADSDGTEGPKPEEDPQPPSSP